MTAQLEEGAVYREAGAGRIAGKVWWLAAGGIGAFVLALPVLVSSAGLQNMLSVAAIMLIAAYGLFVLYAYLGQMFVCQAALMGVGAYTAAILSTRLDLSFWLSLVIAVLVSMVIGFCTAGSVIRSRGHYFVIATFVIGEFMVLLMKRLDLTGGIYGMGIGRRPEGLGPVRFDSISSMYYLVMAFLALAVLMVVAVRRSPWYWRFNAIRENENQARAVGIDVEKMKLIAAVLSSAFAGAAGVLFAFQQGFIDPTEFAAWYSVKLIFIIIIGAVLAGPHSLWGPPLGAVIVVLLPEALGLPPVTSNIVYSSLIVVLVLGIATGVFDKLGPLVRSRRMTSRKQTST